MNTDIAKLALAVDSEPVDKASDRLERMNKEASNAEKVTAKLISTAAKFVGAYATWQTAEGIVRKFISSTAEAEKAQAQLQAALKSTGNQVGYSAGQLSEMATKLQRVTTYGDEAIIGAQSLLLTFTKIGHDTFPEATEAVLNVATAMGSDLKSAAVQVGKALNDPIQGVTALARSGIQFSDSQKAMIKSLVDTGKVAEAQKIVLKELENQFGGSARAARGTLGGALAALEEAFGDLFEATGPEADALRNAVEGLITAITDPDFIAAVQNLGASLFNAFADALPAIQEIITKVAVFFQTMSAQANDPYLKNVKDRGPEGARKYLAQQLALGNVAAGEKAFAGVGGYAGLFSQFQPVANDNSIPTRPGSGASGPTEDQIKAMEKAKAAYDKVTASARERIEASQIEAQTLGMTTEAANRLRYTHDLLADAERGGTKATAAQRAELAALAAEMAATEERTRQLTEAYNFGKEVFGSFFSDIKQGLMDGASLWDVFANAASNALNKIADKALSMAADGIFDLIWGSISGSLFGGGGASVGAGLIPGLGSFLPNAKGNAFSGASGLSQYSNQIVSRPTMFAFAKGAGLMGEAGPEAIMPLRRTADGRLGVAANDNAAWTVKVYNQNGSRVTTRENKSKRELEVFIRDTVRDASRRAAI